MDKRKARVSIDQAKCSPCSELICVGSCPIGILEQGRNKKPQVVDESSCSECGVCASHCPNKAITVATVETEEK